MTATHSATQKQVAKLAQTLQLADTKAEMDEIIAQVAKPFDYKKFLAEYATAKSAFESLEKAYSTTKSPFENDNKAYDAKKAEFTKKTAAYEAKMQELKKPVDALFITIFKRTCKRAAEILMQQTDVNMQHQLHLYKLSKQSAITTTEKEKKSTDSKTSASTVTTATSIATLAPTQETTETEYKTYLKAQLQKAYTQVFTLPDENGFSPIDHIRKHMSRWKKWDEKQTTQPTPQTTLAHELANWMHNITPAESALNPSVITTKLALDPDNAPKLEEARTAGLEYLAACNNYYQYNKKNDAIRSWFNLVEKHTHIESLKELKKHYETSGYDLTASYLNELLTMAENRWLSSLYTLKTKHQSNNIFLIYWKEIMLPQHRTYHGNYNPNHTPEEFFDFILNNPNITDYTTNQYDISTLFNDVKKDRKTYFLIESLPPGPRDWLLQRNGLYIDLTSGLDYPVSAVANITSSPIEMIKLAYVINPSLNNDGSNISKGLGDAAYNNNLALVEWFLDQKQHPGRTAYYTLTWKQTLFKSARYALPLRNAIISVGDDTAVTRRLCEQYLQDNYSYEACRDITEILKHMSQYNVVKNNKSRYLKCFYAMTLLNWPTSNITDKNHTASTTIARHEDPNATFSQLEKDVSDTLAALTTNNQTDDVKHLKRIFENRAGDRLKKLLPTQITDDAEKQITTTQPFHFIATHPLSSIAPGPVDSEPASANAIKTANPLVTLITLTIAKTSTTLNPRRTIHTLTKTLQLADSEDEQNAIEANIIKSFAANDGEKLATEYLQLIAQFKQKETAFKQLDTKAADFKKKEEQFNQDKEQYIKTRTNLFAPYKQHANDFFMNIFTQSLKAEGGEITCALDTNMEMRWKQYIHEQKASDATTSSHDASITAFNQRVYTTLATTIGPDQLSPLQHIKRHTSLFSDEDKAENNKPKTLSQRLLEEIENGIDKQVATSTNITPTNSNVIEDTYEKACRDNDVKTWFKLAEQHTHVGALHQLTKYYEAHHSNTTEGYRILTAITDTYLKDNEKLLALKNKHKTNNIFIIYWRENHPFYSRCANQSKWADVDTYITTPNFNSHYLQYLFENLGGIKHPRVYFLLELLPPSEREWYRNATYREKYRKETYKNKSFLDTIFQCLDDIEFSSAHEKTSSIVAAAASFPKCPVEVMKIAYVLHPHLNNCFRKHATDEHVYTGLAYAAEHTNVAVIQWFFRNDHANGNKAHYTFQDAVYTRYRALPLACALLDDALNPDTSALREICEHSLHDPDTNKYNSRYKTAFTLLTTRQRKESTPKSRYLLCFTAMALLAYTSDDFKNQDASKFTEVNSGLDLNILHSDEKSDAKQPNMATTTTTTTVVTKPQDRPASRHTDPNTTLLTLETDVTRAIEVLQNARQIDDLKHLCELFNNSPSKALNTIVGETLSNIPDTTSTENGVKTTNTTPIKETTKLSNNPHVFIARPTIGSIGGRGPATPPDPTPTTATAATVSTSTTVVTATRK
ncbi:hypothetical protein AYO45_03395 [Gammaproteobacteria bacterium SCGC AG-212-F23]|nr:hypothetical protein AYO45_03395 [Gammaproteobacteria bacterium SCGC AG-212-F23]